MNMPVDTLADPIAGHAHAILAHLGEDPRRPGLAETPRRFAAALRALTAGYEAEPEDVIGRGVFDAEGEGLVLVRDVEFHSLCEHHLLPFFGRVHVAYLPGERIIGLSKIPRVVDAFARRLQVQERLTVDVRNCIEETLKPQGVAVVIEAQHMCMVMRGIQKQHSIATTSAFTGEFNTDKTRAEFMRLIGRGSPVA